MQKNRCFKFASAINDHTRGEINCGGCRWDYPKKCLKDKCRGLVHIDYNPICNEFCYYCDKCEDAPEDE
jgi:hypothetical protein